jgi:L-lactate dehydrogenase
MPAPPDTAPRYPADALTDFAAACLARAGQSPGLPPDRARIVAATLVEADLMGHTTHGLALLAPYLAELEAGAMQTDGDPETLADHPAAVTWDGRYLPGPWLIHRALDLALERIADHPVVTVAIGYSHHTACLATYLTRATDRGLMLLIACSGTNCATVAPFGGLTAVYSPNPLAVGIPTGPREDGNSADPILIDISTSTTANGLVAQARDEGRSLPHPWLQTPEGRLSDDPAAFFADPPATILPLGGHDAGHKGFALGLLVEALTGALTGRGRADKPQRWGNSVFLQLIDPDAFGGREGFLRETRHLAAACNASQPRNPDVPVRLPGARALALRAERLRDGIPLHDPILASLRSCATRCGIDSP